MFLFYVEILHKILWKYCQNFEIAFWIYISFNFWKLVAATLPILINASIIMPLREMSKK